MRPQKIHVEHHAHGDEKQAHEYVAVGQNARNDAHAVLGSGQHEPGQKGPQRKGKAQNIGEQGHAQAKAQGGEQQNFPRAGAHHGFHKAVEAEAGKKQHRAQHQHHPKDGKEGFLK